MKEFENKVIIVTGGASGIGKSICEEFNKANAKVVIIDKKEPNIPCDFFYKGDITEKDVIIDFTQKVIEKYKKVDFIINNAGLSKGGLLSCDLDDFLYVQKLSLFAPFALVKLFLNNLNDNAVIINISSTRAFQSQADWESYAAAKGGVIAFTKSLAKEVGAYNITANCIAPGPIETKMLAGTKPSWVEKKKGELVIPRFGVVEEVAPSAVLLAAVPDGNIYTGQTLGPNCGDVMM